MSEEVVVVSRYCPSCKAQVKAWKLERVNGHIVERCIDCSGTELTELRETVGKLDS